MLTHKIRTTANIEELVSKRDDKKHKTEKLPEANTALGTHVLLLIYLHNNGQFALSTHHNVQNSTS